MMGAKAWLMRGDRWIPGMIVLGFVVMIIANGTMVWVALSTWTGLTTGEAYNRGLAYNETIAQAETRDALGWTVDIETSMTSDGHEAELVIADANGAPIDGATIIGRFVRPTHEGYDFDVNFSQVGAGRYRAAFWHRSPVYGICGLKSPGVMTFSRGRAVAALTVSDIVHLKPASSAAQGMLPTTRTRWIVRTSFKAAMTAAIDCTFLSRAPIAAAVSVRSRARSRTLTTLPKHA